MELQTMPRVLHIVTSLVETSAPYNEHCLPLAATRTISVCSYFPAQIVAPDGITVFDGDGTLSGFFHALSKALATNTYDVVHVHHVHVGLLFLLKRLFTKQQAQPATVYTFHSAYPNYTWRNRMLLVIAFAGVDQIVCCSKASFNSLPWVYKALTRGRISVVPNGVDIDRLDDNVNGGVNNSSKLAQFAQRKAYSNNHFTMTAVGRLIDVKNPLVVLNAFLECATPGSRLVFVGDGLYREQILARGQAAGLAEQIALTGLIPRDEVYLRMSQTDLFISASKVEGLPIAVMEAMACRRPVLLSDIPAHRELAEGTDFIPLVAPDDTADFAREIERFRAMSPAERSEIGKKCRNLVEEKFSVKTMHEKYRNIYAQVIE